MSNSNEVKVIVRARAVSFEKKMLASKNLVASTKHNAFRMNEKGECLLEVTSFGDAVVYKEVGLFKRTAKLKITKPQDLARSVMKIVRPPYLDGRCVMVGSYKIDKELYSDLIEKDLMFIPGKTEADSVQILWGITAKEFHEYVGFGNFKVKAFRRFVQISELGHQGVSSFHVGKELTDDLIFLSNRTSSDGEGKIDLATANYLTGRDIDDMSLLNECLSFEGYVKIGFGYTFVKGHFTVCEYITNDRGHKIRGIKVMGHHFCAKAITFKQVTRPFMMVKHAKGRPEAAVSILTMSKCLEGITGAVLTGLTKMVDLAAERNGMEMLRMFKPGECELLEKMSAIGMKQADIEVLAYARALSYAKLHITNRKTSQFRLPGTRRVEIKGRLCPEDMATMSVGAEAFMQYVERSEVEHMEVDVVQPDGSVKKEMAPILKMVLLKGGKTAMVWAKKAGTQVYIYLGTMDFDDNAEIFKTCHKLPNGSPMFLAVRHPVNFNGVLICDIVDDSNTKWIEYDLKPRYYGSLLEVSDVSETSWDDEAKTTQLNKEFEDKLVALGDKGIEAYKQAVLNTPDLPIEMGPEANAIESCALTLLDGQAGAYAELLTRIAGIDQSDLLDWTLSGIGDIYNHLLHRNMQISEIITDYKEYLDLVKTRKIKVAPLCVALKQGSALGRAVPYSKDEDAGAYAGYLASQAQVERLAEVLESKRQELCAIARAERSEYKTFVHSPISKANICWVASREFDAKGKEAADEAAVMVDGKIMGYQPELVAASEAYFDSAKVAAGLHDANLEAIYDGLYDRTGALDGALVKAGFGLQLYLAYIAKPNQDGFSRNTKIGQDPFFFHVCAGMITAYLGKVVRMDIESQRSVGDNYLFPNAKFGAMISPSNTKSVARFGVNTYSTSENEYALINGDKVFLEKNTPVFEDFAIQMSLVDMSKSVVSDLYEDRVTFAETNGLDGLREYLGLCINGKVIDNG